MVARVLGLGREIDYKDAQGNFVRQVQMFYFLIAVVATQLYKLTKALQAIHLKMDESYFL